MGRAIPIIKDFQLPSWIYFFLLFIIYKVFPASSAPVSGNALSFFRFNFIKTRIGIFFSFFPPSSICSYIFLPLPVRAMYRILKKKKYTVFGRAVVIPDYYKTSFQFDRGSLFSESSSLACRKEEENRWGRAFSSM